MAAWRDGFWMSRDGLRLHYRDYPGPADRPPILCLPGLTRNARDFADMADRLAGEWRLICVDLRGRGESAWAEDAATYAPPVYLEDIDALLAELGIARFVAFGTSLGGLLTAFLSLARPDRIAGALLNDIGPLLEPGGMARIRSYVGRPASWPGWPEAARAIAGANAAVYPDNAPDDWIAMAKRLCRIGPDGRVIYDYDMRIAEPMRASVETDDAAAGTDSDNPLWPAFESLGAAPVTLLRGALSDLLAPATAEAMRERVAGLDLVEIPRVGHTPTLTEPESIVAIDRLLARIG